MTEKQCIEQYKEHDIRISADPKSDGIHRCSRCKAQDLEQETAWPGFEHPDYRKGGILLRF